MLRIPGIILFILSVCSFTQAQYANLKPARLVEEASRINTPVPLAPFTLAADRNQVNVPNDIQEYSLLQLDRESLTNLSENNLPYITLSIPQEGRSSISLELVEVPPFAEGFRIITAPSMTPVKLAHGKHYRGIISGQSGSVAAVSFFDDEIMGFIAHPAASGNIIIGKLEGQSSHIVYQDDQIASRFASGCDTEASDKKYTPAQLRGELGHDRSLSDCVRLYLEADHDIYLNKGSNTGNVTNFVTGIFNQVSTLYANEQINTIISELVIWTQPSPYNATTTIGMLNAFTAYRQGFNGDLAQLLSYKVGGGVAYIDGLCRPNPDFSMSYSGITSTYQNVPTYSWTVEVCAHEFGHLFGSQHTHACVWNGNNTAIDGCFTTEGGCPSPGLPSGGGTVMSYCHLTSAGINFANGFGVQPGNVMRYEVTNASCLQACPGGGGDGGGGNPCTENALTLELRTDNYPAETTWNIKNAAGAVIYSGGPYATPNTLNTVNLCLPTGCYTFTINDSYGDGICCTYGSGFYKIKQGGTTLIQGGQFASSEMKPFCASGSGPSCTDGIQNGQETGVDCGGPNCPACPTCTDGIQNGQETGIDCGGPTCPACPTCNDGIQNGQETGIDCGGPTCQPCQTNGGVIITQLAGHYFETGWDGWIDGGVDCARLNTASAPEGSFAIQLRDNDGTFSSMTSPVYNLTQYDSVTVEFKFRALSFETGEDFWLRYYNGSAWTTIKAWVTPADFANNTVYTRKVRLNAPLASNAQFRFQSDASDNFDQVLIDAVVIKGYKSTGTPPVATCTDGIQNGQETGIDCGGPACPACPNCTDGIQNGLETGVDCGGPACPPCNTASCTDGVQNGQETGIDCGGPACPACPTCTDGIQNGQETGVDCGGPACPPCNTSSCTDGIQNGQETGIDCGGPTCPVCPTCSDGIQNGQETGVDCGGPSCPPCNNGGNPVTIFGHYFETGWDGWIDGGSDCFRYAGPESPEGTYSIRLRDNSGDQSAMVSGVYNLSPYNLVNVVFSFRAEGMETGEDFWLQISDGTAWSTVATFVSGTSFVNNQLYTVTVNMNGPFSSQSKFRFQCDASENDDNVYIDAVVVTASTASGLFELPVLITPVGNQSETDRSVEHQVTIYPNPASDVVYISSSHPVSEVQFFSTAGKLLATYSENHVNISALNPGIYILRIRIQDQWMVHKFMKQ
jgi:hypothetical protein